MGKSEQKPSADKESIPRSDRSGSEQEAIDSLTEEQRNQLRNGEPVWTKMHLMTTDGWVSKSIKMTSEDTLPDEDDEDDRIASDTSPDTLSIRHPTAKSAEILAALNEAGYRLTRQEDDGLRAVFEIER